MGKGLCNIYFTIYVFLNENLKVNYIYFQLGHTSLEKSWKREVHKSHVHHPIRLYDVA